MQGWTKLNTDGSLLRNCIKARGGGCFETVMRIRCLVARALGNTTIIITELWTLKDDLVLAQQLRISSLVVELDAETILC